MSERVTRASRTVKNLESETEEQSKAGPVKRTSHRTRRYDKTKNDSKQELKVKNTGDENGLVTAGSNRLMAGGSEVVIQINKGSGEPEKRKAKEKQEAGNQGFVHVNSKHLTRESLQTLTRLDTIQAVLPTVSNPAENEVKYYTSPQTVTNIFIKTTIPSYSVLQLWKCQLQRHIVNSCSGDGQYYIEVIDSRYDMECIEQMLILHKARDIRSAVEKELEWFAGQLITPKSVVKCPSSDSMRKFQDLVFHQKWDQILVEYSMSGDELAKICCGRWPSDDIMKWTLNLINQSQEDTLCIYHDTHPSEINRKYIKECLDKRKRSPSALIVLFGIGRCSEDKVCFSSDNHPGCRFCFCHVTSQDGGCKAVYGDPLGWSAPDNLHDILSAYFEIVFKCPPSELDITSCHDPKQNASNNEHTCSTENLTCAQFFPLQNCGSHSGVVALIMAALACFRRSIFDLLTTTHSPHTLQSFKHLGIRHLTDPSSHAKYLRRVLAAWIADGEISIDFLVPRNVDNDETDDEDRGDDDDVDHQVSSSFDHDQEDESGREKTSSQRNSHQVEDEAVQYNGTTPSNNSECGASTPSSDTTDASAANDQHDPKESSTHIHRCPHCSYKTVHTFNMKRHFKRNHPDMTFTPPLAHTCPKCSFGSNKSADIAKHVGACHPGVRWAPPILRRGPKAKEGPKRHKCPQCHYQSNSKHNINRHQQSCHETTHALESSRVGKCQCLECGQRLYKISDLRRHLSTKHAFIFKTETVTLDSYEEFEEWKASIEIAEGCSFTKTTGDKVIQGCKRTQYFQCNRSGMFRSNNKGKRRQKWQGSCKIESNCTATMIASILDTGKVEVECVCTHYSHQIELQHVWIPKGHKREDALKGTHSRTREDVMKDVYNSIGNVHNRHHALSNQAIPDVVDVFTPSVIQRQSNDRASLLSWIKQWEGSSDTSPILTYNIDGNSDGLDFGVLQSDDFVIVIQTELQKEMMLKFHASGVCCDCTDVSTKFVLTTLRVISDIGQTVPVAHCISNSNTEAIINIFFSKLKQTCGDLAPAWMMSQRPGLVHNSWTSVFSHKPRHLTCPWSVDKAWTETLKKTIGNTSVETRVHKLLKILLEQTDQKVFEDHLHTLLDRLSVSAKTQEFRRYFLNEWVNRKHEWCYCGNKDDTFPPNTFTEPFFQVFQYEYSQETISECLDTCAFHLLKYARDCLANRCISLTKGKPVLQAEDMQRRHDVGVQMGESCVRACPDGLHRWDVVETNEIIHTVQESPSICKYRKCPISCLQCHICIHQYMCTCLDSLTNITICSHIHLVHSSLHKDQGGTPMRDTQWLKDRIQSRVHRLLAVVSSTGDEHFSVLQELDSKLGVCSSLMDSRLLWGATSFVQPQQDVWSQSGAGGLSRKEKKRIGGVDGARGKKKQKKQDADADHGKDKCHVTDAVSASIPAAVSGSTIQDGSTQLNQPITTILPTAGAALIPIHVTTPQHMPPVQDHAHHMTIPPVVLTSEPPIVITSDSPTSQHTATTTPPVMSSHIELQTSQPGGIVTYPSPRPITSTPHPHQFTPLPHQPIIHTPGCSGSVPHTHHPQLSGISSYQALRPVLASQLSPGTAQQVHVDFHQAVRPLGHVESQQLAIMSDEQLTTLAGVASALFGDG